MSKGASKIEYTYSDNGKEKKAQIPLDRISEDAVLSRLIAGNQLLSIHSSEPTLNDIFVEITGRRLQ